LSEQPTHGHGGCHITTDGKGQNVLVAHYNSGTLVVSPVQKDGHLGPILEVLPLPGPATQDKGVPQRQEAPPAHQTKFDGANRFVFVPDLGSDQLVRYDFDPKSGKLAPNLPLSVHEPFGQGPRHLDFHPSGKFAYAINELSNTVATFAYDGSIGR